MRTSSRAELGAKLRRDQTRCVAAGRRCGPWCAAVVALLGLGTAAGAQNATAAKDDLPDAPSAQMSQSAGAESPSQVSPPMRRGGPEAMTKAAPLRPCKDSDYTVDKMPLQGPPPCIPENPISPFVTSAHVEPLTSKQKGMLAMRDFLDPFNFITIAGYSAIATAAELALGVWTRDSRVRKADGLWAAAGCAGRVLPDVCDSFAGAPGPALSPDADRECEAADVARD